jgi:Leucine-rich repeat (LRR) protein
VAEESKLVYNNKTGELPEDLMEQYPNITSLIATNLDLKNLTGTFKRNQTVLKNLDLSQNLLTVIQDWEFRGLRNLTTLSLANNLLREITVGAFYGLSNLQKIMLSHNRIQILAAEFFRTVEELQIDNNQLENFKMDFFVSGTSNMRKLELQNNQIGNISSSKNISVQELNLSGNNIVDLDFLRHCKNLESLDLSFNVNATLTNQTFEYNTELTNLTMQNMSLIRVGETIYNLLSYSSNLEQLDIGCNQLESINFERMPNLPKLRSMKLTGNELTEFNTSKLKEHCVNLSEIDITGNKLNDSTLKCLVQYCLENNITLIRTEESSNTLIFAAIALIIMCFVILAVWFSNFRLIRRYQKGVDFDLGVASSEDDLDEALYEDVK